MVLIDVGPFIRLHALAVLIGCKIGQMKDHLVPAPPQGAMEASDQQSLTQGMSNIFHCRTAFAAR